MFDKRLLLALLLLAFGRISAQSADSIPELTFDVDTADFGIVEEGKIVEYDFWFTNTGKKDLSIKQAWPACGCTHPTYTEGFIKPGERGKVHVEFHSKNFGGDTVVKSVIIINNGPERYAVFRAIIVNSTIQQDIEKSKEVQENKSAKKKGRKRRK